MSLSNAKTEKKKPRAMPVETIVTRFKSAQQKRLLEKDQTKMTTKTKNKKSSKKSQPNLNNVERKSPRHKKTQKSDKSNNAKNIEDILVDKNEYYPNKLKRKLLNARKFLAPKQNSKIICSVKSLNKRKLHKPQRDKNYIIDRMNQPPVDIEKSLKQKAQSSDLSIIDMVRIIEENGTLDDEDLLEILTCPSPVWWEESPEGFAEDALFSQNRPAECLSVKTQIQEEVEKKENERKREEDKNETNNNDNESNLPDSLDISIEKCDKNFMNKRCKLETLLCFIKNKGVKPLISKLDTTKNISENIEKDGKEEEQKSLNDKSEVTAGDNEDNKLKRHSECTEEELTEFRDDEKLKHLENLEIPVEITLDKEDNVAEEIEEIEEIKTELISIRLSIESQGTSEKDMSEEYLDLSFLDDAEGDERICDEANLEHVEPHNTVKSDDSSKINVLEDNNKKSADYTETINKNNVKNADFNENNKIKNKIERIIIDDDKEDDKIDKEIKEEIAENKDIEFVTVYKIINNEINGTDDADRLTGNIDKIKDKRDKIDKGTINSYYKHCKRVSNVSHKSKNFKINDKIIENKTIIISDTDNVKYCFVCSSIFDSETCNYCLRRSLKRKFNEYSCDVCGYNVNTKQEMIVHLRQHSEDRQ